MKLKNLGIKNILLLGQFNFWYTYIILHFSVLKCITKLFLIN